MANTILTATAILNESLALFQNNLVFGNSVNRQYDSRFKNLELKPGTSLQVRKPVRHTVTTGAAMATQDIVEETVTVNCATQKHVDISFTSEDLTMKISDFSDRYLKTAMAKLASVVDYDGLTLYKDVPNLVGTAGTTPATALVHLQAGQKMDEFCAPRDGDRSIVLNPAGQAATVNGLTGLFQSSEKIKSQYEKGVMGTGLGFDFKMDQNVNVHTCGSRIITDSIVVATNSAEGDTTLAISGSTGSKTFLKGDVFTIGGVYAANPETGQSTGSLQQFVVTADVTASGGGAATLAVYPTIRSTGALKTVTVLPDTVTNKSLTFVGVASTAYPMNMAFHKDAFTLVTADLVVPKGVDMGASTTYKNVSMRLVRQYDINNDRLPCRIDIYYGWTTLRPEWACRVIG